MSEHSLHSGLQPLVNSSIVIRPYRRPLLLLMIGAIVAGCAPAESVDTPASGGSGQSASGGSGTGGAVASTGGVNGTGGAVPVSTGGADVPGTGGASSGGAPGTGGRTATGGSSQADAGVGGRAPSDAGAGGAVTGMDGSTSTSTCGVDPVTPNATTQTRKALCYLYSIYGKKILSGQEENNDDNAQTYIYNNTGKYPAIRAFDINNSKAASQCVAHAKKGGLCMYGYHMGIVNGDGYDSSKTKTDINQVLTEGSTYNTTFKSRLDKVATATQTAQDAGAVVLMRLFHEAGGTWFWWSMESGAQFVKLWKYAFNYLTVTKGLKNLIWMMPYDGSPQASFYPGKAFVDIGGADNYAGDGKYDPLNGLFNNCVKIFGATMPVALHECGPIPDPAQLQSTNTKWLLFSVWTDNYIKSPSNSVDHLKSVYASDYVITLDEMPGF